MPKRINSELLAPIGDIKRYIIKVLLGTVICNSLLLS